MKIYLPNRDYLFPSLSVSISASEYLRVFSNIFTANKIGFIGDVPINFTPSPISVDQNDTDTGNREFASISFDLRDAPQNSNKFKLFWSNFGYAGKQGKEIYYVFLPNIQELVSKLFKPHPSLENKNWSFSNDSYGFAVDKINAIFAVIIDPYKDLASEIDFLFKMYEKFTLYGSLDPIEKIPASTIRTKLQNLYNLLSTTQITQTFEIYSFNAELWTYQDVWVAEGSNYSAVFGIYGRLIEPDLDNVPFDITFVSGTEDNCVMIIENVLASTLINSSGDDEILKSFFKIENGNITYLAEASSYFRTNTLLWDGTTQNYLDQNGWSIKGFLTTFVGNPQISSLFNLGELCGINNLTSLHEQIIGSQNEKQKSIFEFVRGINNNEYVKHPALSKLYTHEGSVLTKTWGGTPLSTLTSTANEISDLYPAGQDPKSSSPVLYSFISEVILDTENDFIDPSYLDFWFVSTPGIDMLDSSNVEILGLINTLISQYRSGDSLYVFDLFTADAQGIKRKFEDVLNGAINNLISTPHASSVYPDVIITHPTEGEDVVLGGGTLLIKLGQLEKIWRSPAGSVRGLVDFAKGVVRKISKINADGLYTDAHINPIIKPTKFATFQIEGNRTLYKKGERVKSALSSLNVKTTIMHLIRVLREVLYTFKFEPNTPGLFLRFQNLVSPELDRLLGENAIYSYKLADLTTDDDRNRGRAVFAIGIQPTREAEIIVGKIYVFPVGVEISFE